MILIKNLFITTILLCLVCVYSLHASSLKTLTLEKGEQLVLKVYLDDNNNSEEIEHIQISIRYDSNFLLPLGFRKDNGILSNYALNEMLQIQDTAIVNIYGKNVYTQFGSLVELVLKAKEKGRATIYLNKISCNDHNLSGGFWIDNDIFHKIDIDVGFYISDIEDRLIYEDTPVLPVTFSVNIPNNDSIGFIPMSYESSNTDIVSESEMHTRIKDTQYTIFIHPKINSFGQTDISIHAQYNKEWDSKTFSIQVLPVNDAPTFSIPTAITLAETSGFQVLKNWATNISPGAPNEVEQELSFIIQVDHPDLFYYQPEIDPDTGDLQFFPFDNVNGLAQLSVYLKDDGDTLNEGHNLSTRKECTLTITPFSPAISENPVEKLTFISSNQPISLDKVTPYIRVMACDANGDAVNMKAETQIWLQTESPDTGWFYVKNQEWSWRQSNAFVFIREGEHSALFKYRNGRSGAFQIKASETPAQSWSDAIMTVQVQSDTTEIMGDIDDNGLINLKDVIREMQFLSR
jgi:hypothetical protein